MDHAPGKNPESPPPPQLLAFPLGSPVAFQQASSKLRQGAQMALLAPQTPCTGQRTLSPFFRKQTSSVAQPPRPRTPLFSAETNPLIEAKAPVNPRLIKAATKLAKKRAHGMEESIANKQEAGDRAEMLSVPILGRERCGYR